MHHAYAKINIGLRILEQRPDGYHNIETVLHRIAWSDEVDLEPAAQIEVTTTNSAAPDGEENICHTAARLLQQHLGERTGARIHIRKAIPVGAGLGGGSADAALVLRELPHLWGREITDDSLRDLALQLGSDVPYFLEPGSAVARGRGEQLVYARLDIPYTILLCYPNIHVSTAWAYREAARSGKHEGPDFLALLREGLSEPARLRRTLTNDFEPTVFAAHPEIADVKETMLTAGAVYASMSGSGSSIYGFFEGTSDATKVESGFKQRGYMTSITPPGFNPH